MSINWEAFKPAGFWRRVVSVCVDTLILLPLTAVYYYATFTYPAYYWLATLLLYLPMAAYYGYFLSHRWQATPGMRASCVYAVDTEGARLSTKRAVGWLLIFALFFYLSVLPMMLIVPPTEPLVVENPEMSAEEAMQEIELLAGAFVFMFIFLLLWALTVVIPRHKTGLHNKLVGVRFLKGHM